MLRLRDIMTTDLLTVSPEQTLRDAMELLTTRHVSGAPVMAGGKVVGVVSLTDLAAFAASVPGVPTVRPDQEEPEERETEEEPSEWVDGVEPPSAFFTAQWADVGADVSERFAEVEGPEWNVLEEHTVSEVMTRHLQALPPDTQVDRAADFMRTAGVHRVLVMEGESLLGLVSTRDIANAVADHRLTTRTYVFDPRNGFDARGWRR